jgi:hypothetical protein
MTGVGARVSAGGGPIPAGGGWLWRCADPVLGAPAVFRRPGVVAGLYAATAGLLIGAALARGPLAAMAAFGVALTGFFILRWPLAGAYLLVALVPVTSGLRRDLPMPGLRLSEVLIVAIASLLLLTVESRRAWRWGLFDWLALAYAAATLLLGLYDLLQRGTDLTTGHLGTLLGPFQFLLLYRALLAVVRTETERRRVLALVLIASVPVSVLALVQFAGASGVTSALNAVTGANALVVHSEEVGIQDRVTGVFPHWQMLAGYLFVVVVVGFAGLLAPGRPPLRRAVLAGITTLAALAMVSSGTFVTTFGALAAALALAAWYRRLSPVAAALGATAGGAALLLGSFIQERIAFTFEAAPGTDRAAFMPQSVAYRVELWTGELLPALTNRLLTGYGPDLPAGLTFQHTESMYLTLLFRGGVPLLLIYAGLMLALAGVSWRLVKARSPFDRMLGRTLVVLVALLAVLHLLEPYFVTSGLPHLIWILAALAMPAVGTRLGDA